MTVDCLIVNVVVGGTVVCHDDSYDYYNRMLKMLVSVMTIAVIVIVSVKTMRVIYGYGYD